MSYLSKDLKKVRHSATQFPCPASFSVPKVPLTVQTKSELCPKSRRPWAPTVGPLQSASQSWGWGGVHFHSQFLDHFLSALEVVAPFPIFYSLSLKSSLLLLVVRHLWLVNNCLPRIFPVQIIGVVSAYWLDWLIFQSSHPWAQGWPMPGISEVLVHLTIVKVETPFQLIVESECWKYSIKHLVKANRKAGSPGFWKWLWNIYE